MTKRKAKKATRKHLATLADQLPLQRGTSPVKLTLLSLTSFTLGALIGVLAGLASASPQVRKHLSEGEGDLAQYLVDLKTRAQKFGEDRQNQPPQDGQPA